MSKEEILKIQKCVLKVNIHCDGCKHKVKKILQKIDGVFTTEIDAEQGKVTVSGNVDPKILIKKLAKSGKHAELWGAPKPNNNNNNNQNYLLDQLKNMQVNHPKGGGNHNNSKGQNQKGGGNNNNNQAKGGGGGQQGPIPQQQQQLQLQQQQLLQQQLQQLQPMKGLQDLNLPQFKDFKLPPHNPNTNPNAKSVKFDIPEEEEDFSDDELDDFDDDDDFHDEFDDDEMDYLPPSKMKLPPMMMNAPKSGNNGSGGSNGKKGGPVPIQVHGIPDGGGKKGNSSGGNSLNQGGGNKNNGNKNGGGVPVGKNGGGNKNNNGGGNNNNNNGGSKKGNPMAMGGVGVPSMNSGFQNMGGGPHVMSGPMSTPIPAVQGLPAAPVNGGGYFRGAGPDAMPGNPFHQQQQLQLQQQQYMAAMMNQQRAMGNDRFQPMMYARPPPAVNYMYPPYPYPPPDPYTHFFSDENTSSCNVM